MSNYAIWGLFGPATWPAWLALLALLAGFLKRTRARWPRRLLIASLALFIAFGLVPTGDWLARPLETHFPPYDAAMADPAHIVVLAGSEELDASAVAGRPEVGGAGDRLLEAAALAHAHPRATLWIAGGVRRHGRADVEWARLAWTRLGIAAKRIRIIDHTLDTCANAAGVAARRLSGEILLVTSAMHMPRAVACFEANGVRAAPYPVDYTIRPSGTGSARSVIGNLRQVDTALHEWIGLAYYRVRGRTSTLLPVG
ncbi:YdcF family protein [Sphingoaurantiacus capsulatus]|uniref:YdcF family protein n=1 Tax=Sphingoaurantiacus capsulatus TaxID=1771310 RepID=A0ABV7XDY5_9SPHN